MLGRELLQTILEQQLADVEVEIVHPEWGGGEPDAAQQFNIVRVEDGEDDDGDTFCAIIISEK